MNKNLSPNSSAAVGAALDILRPHESADPRLGWVLDLLADVVSDDGGYVTKSDIVKQVLGDRVYDIPLSPTPGFDNLLEDARIEPLFPP